MCGQRITCACVILDILRGITSSPAHRFPIPYRLHSALSESDEGLRITGTCPFYLKTYRTGEERWPLGWSIQRPLSDWNPDEGGRSHIRRGDLPSSRTASSMR